MSTATLPSFRKPPVVETVLGVQFAPLSAVTNAHLGAFWHWLFERSKESNEAWSDRWSHPGDAPSLEPVIEQFEDDNTWTLPGLNLHISQTPSMRVQIRNEDRSAMIQVQNDRLHYNWIGREESPYPRYKSVRPKFDAVFNIFCQYVDELKLGSPEPNQWEVTYVNHIFKGTVWEEPGDWSKVLVGLIGSQPQPSTVCFESYAGVWHYQMKNNRGRLHVDAKHAMMGGETPREMIRLTLTARGPVKKGEMPLAEGLDLGRAAIVTTFKEITSAEAHTYWEIDNAPK